MDIPIDTWWLEKVYTVPGNAPAFVKAQGFGNLFNKVTSKADTSLVSLAHAEPFACNYGTNKHVFTLGENGDLSTECRPAVLAYLSGTARMAMINLTIVASVPRRTAPGGLCHRFSGKAEPNGRIRSGQGLEKTGNQGCLDRPEGSGHYRKTDRVRKVGRGLDQLRFCGNLRTAAAILADGGNLNNYAGAVDPDF